MHVCVCVSPKQMAVEFGMSGGVGMLPIQHCLHWLGHMATLSHTDVVHRLNLHWRDIQRMGLDALS